MFKADRLYKEILDLEGQIGKIKVEDADSLVEYFRRYTELIFNYKQIGNLYDIYADNVVVYRENGKRLTGVHEVMKDASAFVASFPDLQVTFADTFAVQRGEEYKLWRYYYMDGTNLGASVYGLPTGKKLGGEVCIVMNMATVRIINGRPQIVKEYTMYSAEWIRQICTA